MIGSDMYCIARGSLPNRGRGIYSMTQESKCTKRLLGIPIGTIDPAGFDSTRSPRCNAEAFQPVKPTMKLREDSQLLLNGLGQVRVRHDRILRDLRSELFVEV
jgi:hypothetical protein